MCFSSDQHPPLPPRSSDVGDHGPTVLTSADGTRFAAYDAVPVTRRGASLVLLPDIRGMHPYYSDLAIAFAQAGIDTVAIDPYARTAGLTDRGEDFDFRPHAQAMERSTLLADAHVAKRPAGRAERRPGVHAGVLPVRWRSRGRWPRPTSARPAAWASTGSRRRSWTSSRR